MDKNFERKLQQTIINFIENKQLFQKNTPLILAVSGGVDSIVMLDFLHQTKFNVKALAHANFQLRGEESEEDMKFVKDLAVNYDLPCFIKYFDTIQEAKQAGESIQMAARRLRYDWLKELLEETKASYILTAHHLDDNLETVLLNLIRGTGWAGLHGILPKQGNIIRPLLIFKKKELLAYAKHRELKWREDSSNAETKYKRNFLRLEVMPLLKQLNPDLENTFQQSLKKIIGVEKVFEAITQEKKDKFFEQKGKDIFISLKILEELTSPIEQLYVMLQEFGFSYPQIENLVQTARSESGRGVFSQNYQIVKDRKAWVLSPLSKTFMEIISLNEEDNSYENTLFSLFCENIKKEEDFEILPNKNIAYLDYDKLKFPLKLRQWQEGDYFQPLGMKGRKKISDFLIDLKTPVSIKHRTFVLISGGSIVWVVGKRIAQKYAISSSTKRVFKITQSLKE